MVRIADEYLSCACRVQQDNPKKNMSADRYERYKAARTLQQVLDLGGSRGDIANDMLRGYIVVEDREIHEAILMTANESERRHLPAHLLDRLPPAGSGSDPRSRPRAPRPPPPPRSRAPPPPPLPRKLAPPPRDLYDRKRPRDATDKSSMRKRAVECVKRRAKIFGRSVGKGRLLPVFDDT